MKLKQMIAGTLTAVLCFSAVSIRSGVPSVHAAKPEDGFHYEQLDEISQRIYSGISDMYGQGLLKTGNADLDLASNGYFSESQLQTYEKNPTALKTAMNAARYAFYADHPEVFYVDFPKLSLRTTKGSDGNFHIYLGSGRYATYYPDGFTNESQINEAIQEFDTRVDELVSGAQSLEVKEGRDPIEEQIRYVHNEIVKHTSYRLEDTCYDGDSSHPSNASFLGSPYGVLVRKQGVCEGYSRAFKAVMDKLGIPCILVQGAHQYDSEAAVAHMWNYVRLNDRWYAVDLTQDDPERVFSPEKERVDYLQYFDEYGNDGFENEKYLLAGQFTMNERHFVNEEVDAAGGYHFTYPALEDNDFGTKEAVNDMDGFLVKQKRVTSDNGDDETEFQISYRGMNVTKAKKEGIYILVRYYGYGEGEESDLIVPLSGWCYFSDSYALNEDDTSVYLREGGAVYMEFAATTVAPREGLAGLTYAGDDYGLIACTGKIYNEYQNSYVAPPFVKYQTPTQTCAIEPGNRPYHVTVVYDETLAMEEGVDAIGYRINCKSHIGEAVTGAEYTTVSNLNWDGDRTVEFDVAFSHMYADNSVSYEIYPTGLVGAKSQKTPNPATFSVRSAVLCPNVSALRGGWDVFGKPTFLEDGDLSTEGWKLSNGKEVSEKLKHRMALVATKPTEKQENQMQEVLDGEFPGTSEEILSSTTFNISLTICKSVVISTGQKVRVRLGFPEGYGPNDAGVVFKAYHFQRDDLGNVSGVEEIDCTVTPYGLVIYCDAFSPFMVAAVKADETVSQEKSLVVTTEGGGSIAGPELDGNRVLILPENSNALLSVKADEGYQIDSLTVCGKEIPITDKDSMDVTVTYDMADGINNIVHAEFIAKAVAEKEEARKETAAVPVPDAISVTLPKHLDGEKGIDLVPDIPSSSGMLSYQWYKDGSIIFGETDAELHISDITEEQAGVYELEVTATFGTVSVRTKSNACRVTFGELSCSHVNQKKVPAKASTCLVHGHEAYTLCEDCGVILSGSDTELPFAKHTYVEHADAAYLQSEATCSTKAVYVKSCSVCGKASSETFTYGKLADHAHTELRDKKDASCTEKGYTGDTYCTDCGAKVLDGKVIPEKDHDLKKVEGVPATHTEDGSIPYYTCSVCGKLFKDKEASKELSKDELVLKKKGHSFSDSYETDDEHHWKACACGELTEKEVHNFGAWKVIKKASEKECGLRERSCSVCDYQEQEEIPVLSADTKDPEEGSEEKPDESGNENPDDKKPNDVSGNVQNPDDKKPNDVSGDTQKGQASGDVQTQNKTSDGGVKPGDVNYGRSDGGVKPGDANYDQDASSSVPKTGDSNAVIVWSILIILSAIVLLTFGISRARRNRRS